MPRLRPRVRVLMGAAGAALMLFGLWVSLISVIVGIAPQSPNPYVSDGDPCCAVPDTWADTRLMAVFGWLWLGAALIPFGAGLLLVWGAIRGRRPRWRRLPIGVAAAMAVAAVAIVVAYVRLDEVPQVAHCRKARERLAAAGAAGNANWHAMSRRILECDLLVGRTSSEVLALLGEPARRPHPAGPVTETWHYGRGLPRVRFERYPGKRQATVSWVSVDR